MILEIIDAAKVETDMTHETRGLRSRLGARVADFIAALSTPSDPRETVYQRAVIGFAHALLGAALLLIAPAWVVLAVYALGKELAWDIYQRSGSKRDSLHDVGNVCFGVGLVHLGYVDPLGAAMVLGFGAFSALIYGVRDAT